MCIKSFCLFCKFIVVEIKQCVLSPLSVSKPPPVVSSTNREKLLVVAWRLVSVDGGVEAER